MLGFTRKEFGRFQSRPRRRQSSKRSKPVSTIFRTMSAVTFKLNTQTMWRAIEEHHRTFRKSYEQLFRVAAKGVAAKAVRLTPPFRWAKSAKDTESDKTARQRGIAAVQIGVLKLFTTSIATAR